MKERILEFLKAENKTSAQFAEEIGVQPSGISHILSGRNNPSLDFVLKMLDKYPDLSTEWLLFGRGRMYRDIKMPSLFDSAGNSGGNDGFSESARPAEGKATGEDLSRRIAGNDDAEKKVLSQRNEVMRVIVLYGDNSFKEYFPH